MDKEYVAGHSDILRLVWASDIEQPALGYDFAGDLEGANFLRTLHSRVPSSGVIMLTSGLDLRVLQGVLIGHRVHYS